MTGRVCAISIAVAGAMFSACAHIEAPPGGAPDITPPGILTTRPEPEAIVPDYDGAVVFVFDERISERGVEEAVMVSPRTSPVEVSRGRDEVRVSLRQGWERGRIYHVTLQSTILDLFGNALADVERLVFSTGPEIPDTHASGTVADRVTGRLERGIRVEAIRTADSLVYAVPTDSAGSFLLDRFPTGEYQIRAFEDINQNRSLEPFESRDSTFVTVAEGDPVEVALRIVAPDSTPPQAGPGVLRQTRIEIEFDDFLDPEQTLDSTRLSVVGEAGDTARVTRVTVGLNAQIYPPAQPDDTVAIESPPASRTLIIELEDSVTLEPESDYVVTVRGIRNVNGLESDIEVTVTAPPGPPGVAALVSPGRPSRYIARRRAT